MSALIDGADSIVVGVAGLDVCIMECRWNDRLRGRDALPLSAGLTAINLVAGYVGLCNRLPAQVD